MSAGSGHRGCGLWSLGRQVFGEGSFAGMASSLGVDDLVAGFPGLLLAAF